MMVLSDIDAGGVAQRWRSVDIRVGGHRRMPWPDGVCTAEVADEGRGIVRLRCTSVDIGGQRLTAVDRG